MTPDELSELLGVPPRSLDQWAYLGRGPAYIKVGRHRRYRRDVVDQWLTDNTKVMHPQLSHADNANG